jgi:hypothetical protein
MAVRMALHIVQKDVRHLWPQVATWLALLTLYACVDSAYSGEFHGLRDQTLLGAALTLACWVTVIAVIHEESPLADRQFWLTLPCARRDLVLAKGLFIAAFINLPVLLCQAAVLRAAGFDLWGEIGFLFWKQVFFTAFLVLPVAGLAAVTRNLGQVLLGVVLAVAVVPAIVVAVYYGSFRRGADWGGLSWMPYSAMGAVLAVGTVTAVLLAYTRRNAAHSRTILAITGVVAVVVLAAPPLPWGWNIQEGRSRERISESAVRLAFDPSAQPYTGEFTSDWVRLEIPVRFDGVPSELEVKNDWTSVSIDGREGSWAGGWAATNTIHDLSGNHGWLRVMVAPKFYESVRNNAVRLHGSLDLTLLRVGSKLQGPSADEVIRIAGVGICRRDFSRAPFSFLSPVCLLAQPRAVVVPVRKPGDPDAQFDMPPRLAYAPYPISPWFGPLRRYHVGIGQWGGSTWVVKQPVAHIQRDFEFQSLRLADYVR